MLRPSERGLLGIWRALFGTACGGETWNAQYGAQQWDVEHTAVRHGTYELQCTMEREVTLTLLQCCLEKRGVESGIVKQVPGLTAYGEADGMFVHSEEFFEEEVWCKFGDIPWHKVIDEDKDAKKLMKAWREVINCIKKLKVEKQVAATASQHLAGLPEDAGQIKPACDYVPIPLSSASIPVQTNGLQEVKEQTKGKVKLAAVDATVNQMLANRYGVSVLCSDGIFFPVPGKTDFPSILLILA